MPSSNQHIYQFSHTSINRYYRLTFLSRSLHCERLFLVRDDGGFGVTCRCRRSHWSHMAARLKKKCCIKCWCDAWNVDMMHENNWIHEGHRVSQLHRKSQRFINCKCYWTNLSSSFKYQLCLFHSGGCLFSLCTSLIVFLLLFNQFLTWGWVRLRTSPPNQLF